MPKPPISDKKGGFLRNRGRNTKSAEKDVNANIKNNNF